MLPRILIPLALVLTTSAADECRFSTSPGGVTFFIRIDGTVTHVGERDDGCWEIRTDDGRRFELREEQAPADLLREGERVRIRAERRDDLEPRCGANVVIEVRDVF